MLSIAWKDEDKVLSKDNSIRGISVDANEVTLNELWAVSPKPSYRRI